MKSLINNLENSNQAVANFSATKLVYSKEDVVEPLINVLNSMQGLGLKRVISTLGRIGDFRAVEPLIALLENENSDIEIRKVVIKSLWLMGNIQSKEEYSEKNLRAISHQLSKLDQSSSFEELRCWPGTTILYVDDARSLLDGITDLFEITFDYNILTASNGIEALRLALATIPKLIVSDIMMPRMGGLELLDRLRSNQISCHIPVIFLSAMGTKEDIRAGRNRGAELYLTKPFDNEELIEEVHNTLENIRLGIYEDENLYDEEAVDEEEIRMNEFARLVNDVEYLTEQVKRLRKGQISTSRLIESGGQTRKTSSTVYPLEEFSRMASGSIHDIRSGLGVIRNTVGFLENDLEDNNIHQADLKTIMSSLDFCELLLRNLASLGGQEIFRPEKVDLEKIVREVHRMLERKLVDVELVVKCSPNLPNIMADKGQMQQLFMNLIKNAGEAMPEGGKITFRATRKYRKETMVRLEISDTGVGISQDLQNKLFKELFTTKEKGYGLGLHIVYTIINRHGGSIQVKSSPGKGTTFIIDLPVE